MKFESLLFDEKGLGVALKSELSLNIDEYEFFKKLT
jgi:hypothetical protein